MNQVKVSGKVVEFSPPRDAILQSREAISRIEVFVARLMESNELLEDALERLRDLYLARGAPMPAEKVLAEVEVALKTSSKVKNGF